MVVHQRLVKLTQTHSGHIKGRLRNRRDKASIIIDLCPCGQEPNLLQEGQQNLRPPLNLCISKDMKPGRSLCLWCHIDHGKELDSPPHLSGSVRPIDVVQASHRIKEGLPVVVEEVSGFERHQATQE